MTILEKILATKRDEVAKRRELYPTKLLEQSKFFHAPTVSLASYLRRSDLSGIIAEIKRKSPSKGIINKYVDIEQVSIGYMQAGASALSILTDETYFGGSNQDLSIARRSNFCPILRKDFVVDEYQIVEARSIGADAILLIASALSNADARRLADFAKSLGLEVLLEIHSEAELERVSAVSPTLVGVNNRDLATFTTDLNISRNLASKIPASLPKIVESGISSPATVLELRALGYDGFLIGETFMKSSRPDHACVQFISELARLQSISSPNPASPSISHGV